jgi:hypothetical protein
LASFTIFTLVITVLGTPVTGLVGLDSMAAADFLNLPHLPEAARITTTPSTVGSLLAVNTIWGAVVEATLCPPVERKRKGTKGFLRNWEKHNV